MIGWLSHHGTENDFFGKIFPIGRWHRSVSLESGTVILESKDGPYVPIGEEDIIDFEK